MSYENTTFGFVRRFLLFLRYRCWCSYVARCYLPYAHCIATQGGRCGPVAASVAGGAPCPVPDVPPRHDEQLERRPRRRRAALGALCGLRHISPIAGARFFVLLVPPRSFFRSAAISAVLVRYRSTWIFLVLFCLLFFF